MFSELTDDELADAGKAFFEEIEARIEAHPNLSLRLLMREKIIRSHMQADRALQIAKAGGVVSPNSGGEPKPN